jgi:hypothetical protein
MNEWESLTAKFIHCGGYGADRGQRIVITVDFTYGTCHPGVSVRYFCLVIREIFQCF